MKIAIWFSLLVVMTVVTVVEGVTGNRVTMTTGLVAVAAFAWLFMVRFVEAMTGSHSATCRCDGSLCKFETTDAAMIDKPQH